MDTSVLEGHYSWLCNALAVAVARFTCTLDPCSRASLTRITCTKAALSEKEIQKKYTG